jgi:hypothetical protein
MDTEKQLVILENLAKKMVEHGKQINPMIVLFTPSEVIPIMAGWRSRQEKYAMVHAVANLAKQKRATACSFISEMWFATPDKGEKNPEDQPVSERADKREGVLISVKEASGKEINKTFEIEYRGKAKGLREVNLFEREGKKATTENYLLEEVYKAIDWNIS